MNEETKIKIEDIVAFYKQEVAVLVNDRVVLKARIKALEEELRELKSG